MAVEHRAIFGGKPISPIVNLSVAKSSNAVEAAPVDATDFRLLFTAGAEGGFIDAIDYQFVGTGTPGAAILNIWVTDNAGANARVMRSITVAAGSAMTTSVPGPFIQTAFNFANLEPGCKVFCSITALAANTTLNVIAWAGQYTAQ